MTVLNSPGTIDSDYRGEVKVILINLGEVPFRVHRGERIAQLVVAPVMQASLARAKVLDATARGKGGFGSTRGGDTAAARNKLKAAGSRKKVRENRGLASSVLGEREAWCDSGTAFVALWPRDKICEKRAHQILTTNQSTRR